MTTSDASSHVTTEQLAKYDRPGPRYTSYPTAVEFNESYTEANYRAALKEANTLGDAPLSFYTHLPFCEVRCHFCGCHVVATKKREIASEYVDAVMREMDMVAELMPDRRKVAQYHLGGGTPTYLTPEQLVSIFKHFQGHFEMLPNAELAIEADPRVTTREHIDALAELGFNRLSVGVQDFTPEVQELIGRVQTEQETRDLTSYAASKGFTGLNIDLIYGLPLQKEETFAKTLDAAIDLRPDRVVVYSFAYVPWLKGNQKRMDDSMFPDREAKFALLALTRRKFIDAGYQAIGMDHFALPDDELAVAQREGRLYRNFMGYTVMPGADAVGIGVSAIGDVRHGFIQNEKKLSRYYEAINAGKLPVHKGYQRSKDDELRREFIQSLMCNFKVDGQALGAKHGVDFGEYFASEMEDLKSYEAEGLCTIDGTTIRATKLGELFVRNLAMCFDVYLPEHQKEGKKVFSRTV